MIPSRQAKNQWGDPEPGPVLPKVEVSVSKCVFTCAGRPRAACVLTARLDTGAAPAHTDPHPHLSVLGLPVVPVWPPRSQFLRNPIPSHPTHTLFNFPGASIVTLSLSLPLQPPPPPLSISRYSLRGRMH